MDKIDTIRIPCIIALDLFLGETHLEVPFVMLGQRL